MRRDSQKQSLSRHQLSSKGKIRIAAACIATLAVSQAASAGTSYTYSAASGSGLWSDPNSWTPNTAFPVAGDAAIFTGSSAENVTFSGNQSVDTVTISNTGTTTFTPNASGRTADLHRQCHDRPRFRRRDQRPFQLDFHVGAHRHREHDEQLIEPVYSVRKRRQ